jgi:hypothetical protein
MAANQEVFRRLADLPANHEFWKNTWNFTRPVFTNESRQMTDPAAFWTWAEDLPAALQRYIDKAPAVEPIVRPSADAKHECGSCGWQGTKSQMAADHTFEAWSNTVCPECGAWDDFTELAEVNKAPN